MDTRRTTPGPTDVPNPRTGLALAMAGLLVLSGCVAAPTATPQEDRTIRVENGTLPVDANLVFERVTGLLEADVDPPDSVRVVGPEGLSALVNRTTENGSVNASLPPFWVAMRVTRKPGGDPDPRTRPNGVTTGLGEITIFTGDNDSAAVHYVLAHEFVHYVQFTDGAAGTVTSNVNAWTTDGAFVLRGVLEGVAVYTTDEYIHRYIDTDRTNSGLYRELASEIPPDGFRAYSNFRYIYGKQYVDERIDAPSEAERIYRDPPTTSEQLLHGYSPDAEPRREMSVSIAKNGWHDAGGDRLGEAFLRVALRNGVGETTANRAAAGWGNDSLWIYRAVEGADDESFVWVLRWDEPAEATEFVDAFRRYLDARGDRSNGEHQNRSVERDVWQIGDDTAAVERVGQDTTVVLLGARSFVRDAAVSGSNGDVSVVLPEPETKTEPATRANETRIDTQTDFYQSSSTTRTRRSLTLVPVGPVTTAARRSAR